MLRLLLIVSLLAEGLAFLGPGAGHPSLGLQQAQRAELSSLKSANANGDLLLRGGNVLIMDSGFTQIKAGYVSIIGGKIVGVGPLSELSAAHATIRPVIEVPSTDIIMPGLVNTHGHASMSLLRGTADDLDVMTWLLNYIWPSEAALVDEDFVRVGAQLAMLEMLATGTTTFTDMYFFEDTIADAVAEAGMRAVLAESLIDLQQPTKTFGHDFAEVEEVYDYMESFLTKWQGHPTVKAAIAAHAPHTVSAVNLQRLTELAEKHQCPLLIHMAESKGEHGELQAITNDSATTPVNYLADLGFLGPRVLAAHSIHLSEEDIGILVDHNVKVSTCPQSNMKLASGVSPAVRMIELGLNVSLGTDGAASNNDLDMFDEMRSASFLHKIANMQADKLSARQALWMGTAWGAQALGWGDQIGTLEVGKEADVIVVRGDGLSMVPLYRPASALVYSSSGRDVSLTAVRGRVLYKDGLFLTLDKEAIIEEANAYMPLVCAAINDVGDAPLLCP